MIRRYYPLITDFKREKLHIFNNLKYIQDNIKYKGIHREERCFVLCTGPSINTQSLEFLKKEIVFGVSTGYMHNKYKEINPRYYCQPSLTYTSLFTKEIAIKHFQNMAEAIDSSTQIFLSIKEKPLIEKYELLKDNIVNYIYFGKYFDFDRNERYNINNIIPFVQSVPIMVIIIAIYMGFKEIYLLGTEHNEIITGVYKHAFKYEMMEVADFSTMGKTGTDLAGNNIFNFSNMTILFKQYHCLNNIAKEYNVKIFNATAGGILDEFPRVDFESLFMPGKKLKRLH